MDIEKEMHEFSMKTIKRIGCEPPFRNIPVYVDEEVLDWGDGECELSPARYLFADYYDERPLPSCPNCGKKEGARQGSSSWAHSEMCCSDACGLALGSKLLCSPGWIELKERYDKAIGRLGERFNPSEELRFVRREMDKILKSVTHSRAKSPTILK